MLGTLLIAAIVIDVKARRRRRIRGGRRRRPPRPVDNQGRLDRHAPGGSDHTIGGGF
jgi:hypothetical protein